MPKNTVQIIIKGKNKTDSIHSWYKKDNQIFVTYLDGKTYSYNTNNVQVKRSILSDKIALNCFNYLKAIAEAIGIKDNNDNNILLNHYEKIETNFINESSMLATFLTGKLQTKAKTKETTFIYPFGFNVSQKTAIDNALTNKLSIIEGPPGTGKTQTILNIIANAVTKGKSVAVVSNNNSATINILEKLKKYNLDFIVANLGNADNKHKFIESQKQLPNLSKWQLCPINEINIKRSLEDLYIALKQMLLKSNELSKLQQKLDAIELEYKHFCKYCPFGDKFLALYLKPTNSSIALELWLLCEKYIFYKKIPNFFVRIINRFSRGVKNKRFYYLAPYTMISLCQKKYYKTKINELKAIILPLQTEITNFNFSTKMNEYSLLSTQLFHNELTKKYKNTKNNKFDLTDLWKNSKDFIARYPVILSTTYSLCSSLSQDTIYDYIIIDEASQVDLATGALALSCAKKAVIVGDLKQLPNVVDSDSKDSTDNIFTKFNLPEMYRYNNHSILSTISELFPQAPKILLKEHYRCHPKIIEFCNQKFYNNQLIILSEPKSKRQPLILYKTVRGNHARDHINQRQIDVIKNEIIPQEKLIDNFSSVGIVTPYRNQTNVLQKSFTGENIQADTVDKFQGREKNIIILCTVDNQISKFTDNSNRLNVAVSRAIEQLILVINGGDEVIPNDTNIADLVNYIKYNNLEIIQSEIYSVFDYLYKDYYKQRKDFLSKNKLISQYDSENLMYGLICDILAKEQFNKFDVATHVSLRMLLRNTEKLNYEEKKYARNLLTHVDFLIFDKIGKTPSLVIEVDGVPYHAEGTAQEKRDQIKNKILEQYNLPFIRFKTNGSNEREQIIAKLEEITKSSNN